MKTIILAAGYATRMYPLTLNFPKPLLSVGEKTIIDYLYYDITSFSDDKIYCVTNERFYSRFQEWAKEKKNVCVLSDGTSTNETRLGALKDILFVLETEKVREDIFVLAGDNLVDFSFRDFVLYAQNKNTSAVMRHFESDNEKLKKTGVCTIDNDERIISMEEKPSCPRSNWAVPPFYYYVKEDLPYLYKAVSSGISTDAPGSFVSYLSSVSSVHAFLMKGKRYDVGSIEGYEKIKTEYKGIKTE